ncbi:MAG: histidine phosphatase family protein [Lactobacillales bacterium]|jgi:broad specificity phosphatase PhoE|nr:histidine phosphatase family protein [Lactobacillales bacterium]
MSKHLIFIRHGETDWNKQGLIQGWKDIPLNDAGIKQAKAWAAKLKEMRVEFVFSSDLARARQTAVILSDALNIPVSYSHLLRERCYGAAEGMTRAQMMETYADIIRQMKDESNPDRHKIALPGGESKENIFQRTMHFIHEVSETTDQDTLLFCTHGEIINTFIKKNFGIHERFDPAEGAYVLYDVKNKTFSDYKKL